MQYVIGVFLIVCVQNPLTSGKYNDHDADSVCFGITVCIVPLLVLIMSFSDLPTAKRKLVFLFLC